MSAKKLSTTFNEYWDFFANEARDRGLTQKKFMEVCGLPKTRYNAFARAGKDGGINITAHYVNKFMEGLRVAEEYVEKKSGRKFTDQQKQALRRSAWSDHNSDIIDALSNNKALTKMVRDWVAKHENGKTHVGRITPL